MWQSLVEVGEQVAAGDTLMVLESMKMENELRAPRACTVSQVRVQSGQSVAGLTPQGEFFRFCQVNPELGGEYAGHDLAATAVGSEWAGATFSRDGEWLFLNVYSPGFTVAITGPWAEGYL